MLGAGARGLLLSGCMGNQVLPALSVVIVTYRRLPFLERCLQALALQSDDLHQVVVVDASPEDQTAAAQAHVADLTFVHAPELAGRMTSSRNRALLEVTGDVVAFLDDDVVVRPGWAAAARRAFAEGRVDGVAGRTLNGLPGEEHPDEPVGTLRRDGTLTAGFAADLETRIPVTHGIGANMLFTTHMLRRLGGFRDDYPGTALREDTDIFLRIDRLGGTVVFDPAVAVDHLPAPHVHGARFDTRYKLYGRRNHMVLLARHRGIASPTVARWVGRQLVEVARVPGVRRKVERLGITTMGVAWGLGAALSRAQVRPADPVRTDRDAERIRQALTPGSS